MSSRPGDSSSLAKLHVSLAGGRSYPVIVGPGASREVPGHIPSRARSRLAIVTDSNLEHSHAAAIRSLLAAGGLDARLVPFPAGEPSKTRKTKAILEDRLLELGCGRDAAVVAVGGGVTGDLAGYVAATYMRGIPWVVVPTSLLAMADASIGGKTGVDTAAGKNLIGVIHQPAAVIADTSFLSTLPPEEFRYGLAEIVKAGIIADSTLFEELEGAVAALAAADPEAVEGPLRRSMAVKIDVVSSDEREADRRKILNFGHTVGHALERLTGYATPHGEAVAVGICAEARMAVAMNLLADRDRERIESLLAGLGLPTRLPGRHSPAEILGAAGTDKKAREGRVEFVLPSAIGSMVRGGEGFGMSVPESVAGPVLEALGEGA